MDHKAGLFSAVLTAFIIDRNQNIQPTPAQQSAFYQQQSVALLNQISQQLTSLGAPIPVPSDSSLPDFTFSPSASDVRVNIIWIISLVTSLTAALFATLIRQWARDYMRTLQLYTDPLVVARIRQYITDRSERMYLVELADAVPGLLHLSLFLFLAGLADFLLNTYAPVGRSTLFAIALCPMIYTIITFAPVINPRSLYRTPFSRPVWFISRRVRIRLRGGFYITLLPYSTMEEGQKWFAMEMGEARKRRDGQAIRWLINILSFNVQDLESLALVIPGSFDTPWGVGVWRYGSENRIGELLRGIGRLFETCRNSTSFKSQDEWRVRSRACTEAIAGLVFVLDANITEIRNLGELLSDVGSNGCTREEAEIRSNQSFAMHWTCLSLEVTRKMLNSPPQPLLRCAEDTLLKLAALHPEGSLTPYERALRSARRIDEQFTAAWNHVERLRQVLEEEEVTWGRITGILLQNEPDLIDIQGQVASMEGLGMDASLSELQQKIDEVTHDLIRKLPGVAFDDFTGPTTAEHAFDLLANPIRPQLICFSKLLRGLCSFNQEWSGQSLQDMAESLRCMEIIPSSLRAALPQSRLMERQLWRIKDLCNGGAFGFTLELYFLSIRHILSTFTSTPRGIHQTILVGAFRAITSGRQRFTDLSGTLPIILNLVYEITFQDRGIFSNYKYPNYITKELLDLLGRTIGGPGSPLPVEDAYIEDAKREIRREDLIVFDPNFRDSARAILGPPRE